MILEKRDWNKIVSESNGQLIFLPEGFRQAAEDWLTSRKEYQKFAQEMCKKEITLNIAVQNLFFELRKYLEKNGHPDVFTKEIGFENSALEDGKFIINTDVPSSSPGFPRR